MCQNNGIQLSHPNDVVKSFEDRLNRTGIFSLSETDINQLMWAHYGDESRGLVFGFEVADGTKLNDDRYCIPVNYADEIPKFEDGVLMSELSYYYNEERPKMTVSFEDPTFRACVSTKPKAWDYERERRYIDETDGAHPFPEKLVEITFGLRCPDEVRRKYIDLSSTHLDYPIRFYEIVKKKNTNQIEKIEFDPCGLIANMALKSSWET